ncbi:MAG TPA: hypothetical protein DCM62_00060 [Bacteroidales bacterium]|nr:hypothetical protein [Bacteroidales bacterium]
MKAVYIAYNQVLTDSVLKMLDTYQVRGFSLWADVQGRGSETGEPHMGTHTWPAMNSAVLAIVKPENVQQLLDAVKAIDQKSELQGIRAFVWNIETMV